MLPILSRTEKYQRYIAIHEITRALGHDICCLLPEFYAITGCDSVSSFHGIGKKSPFSVLRNFSHELLELNEFGADAILSLDHDSVIAATRFVCMLYSKQDSVDINYIRHKLFTQKNLPGDKLPPTLGALSLHLQRANYQSHIWRPACIPILDLPSPEGHGWGQVHGCLELERMIKCKCIKACRTNSFSCRRAKLTYTEACLCNDDDKV